MVRVSLAERWHTSNSLTWVETTILSIIIVASNASHLVGGQATSANPEIVEAHSFIVTRYSGIYHPRTYKGVFAVGSAGQWRMAIYWLDPPGSCETIDCLAFSDIIHKDGEVYFWTHDRINGRCAKIDMDVTDAIRQSPESKNPTELLACILQLASSAKPGRNEAQTHRTEMGRFFGGITTTGGAKYRIPSWDTQTPSYGADASQAWLDTLNAPPTGRIFDRQKGPEGVTVYTMKRDTDDSLLVSTEIGPKLDAHTTDIGRIFDTETLGHWSMVPETYRTYWGLYSSYRKLLEEREAPSASSDLLSDISRVLNTSVAGELALALRQLQIDVALLTDDIHAITHASNSYLVELAHSEGTMHEFVIQAGWVCEQIKQHSQSAGALDFVDPLLAKILDSPIFHNAYFVEGIAEDLQDRRSYYLGQRLIDAIRERGYINGTILAKLSEEIQLSKDATYVEEFDPKSLSPSMRGLINQLTRPPLTGSLTLDQLRQIFDHSLAVRFAGRLDEKEPFINGVLEFISVGAGNGPFRGETSVLTNAIARLDKTYPASEVADTAMQHTLAALLILSFYDVSTTQDHNILATQLRQVFDDTYSQMMQSVQELGFTNGTSPQSRDAFARYFTQVTSYIDDPLWPMFKYPLTDNELNRMNSLIRMRVKRLEKVLGQARQDGTMGGNMEDRRIIGLADVVAVEIPTQVFRVRLPKVDGIQFGRVERAFRVLVPEDMYSSQDRARSFIHQMGYFFLGHRLCMPKTEPDSPPIYPQESESPTS